MTEQQLGNKEEAKGTLARLRDVMKEPERAGNQEAEAFLCEAVELIEGKGTRPEP